MKTTARILVVSLLSVAVLAGCRSTKTPESNLTVVDPGTGTGAVTGGTTTTGTYGPGDVDTDPCLRQRVLHFDFDQYVVRPEYQAVIACHSKYLRDRPSARLTLEGHTDERGSREYNMGLGERRANAVYAALGGSSAQLTTVSFGEERPVATGSNEEAWAQNRRVEIVYSAR